MKVSTYRLTALGWLGAAMFVLPTPIAIWASLPPTLTQGEARFQERLEKLGGAALVHEPSIVLLTGLMTATLIGLVLLLIGREIITSG